MSRLMRIVLLTACLAFQASALHAADTQPSRDAPWLQSKKGIGLATGKRNADIWKTRVEALAVSWHYSWGADIPEPEPDGVAFVPMMWGYWGTNQTFLKRIDQLTAANVAGTRDHLLGFNEPDGKKQANLSVEKALEAWPYLEKTGLRLGSPAPVHADREWMRTFMGEAQARRFRVDFVCVHWYGSPNANALVRKLQAIHDLYGKPVWITEFGVADWKAPTREANRHSPETVLQFMRDVLPKLDALDFVERYAWFPASPDDRALGPSALFAKDGSLTALGRFYASHDRHQPAAKSVPATPLNAPLPADASRLPNHAPSNMPSGH